MTANKNSVLIRNGEFYRIMIHLMLSLCRASRDMRAVEIDICTDRINNARSKNNKKNKKKISLYLYFCFLFRTTRQRRTHLFRNTFENIKLKVKKDKKKSAWTMSIKKPGTLLLFFTISLQENSGESHYLAFMRWSVNTVLFCFVFFLEYLAKNYA